ncbi:hypothetical protein [Paludisphaera mucosa]|uniref:Polysaccharide chain length determinant N-terminal domain-containing protein n=1 Tax=Paludisphaera mucosa TaxID=3030827 RepID=A0ABT6FHD7_9BACT|nr:hypothetical protein [Paludisphaera mucosa]MDG3006896.1 hypothetical protein [Paludisphaera mucosa]
MTSPPPPVPNRFPRWLATILGWLIVLALVEAAIYQLVSPEYEAVSTLRLMPRPPSLFSTAETAEDGERFATLDLETAIATFRTDSILSAALGDPTVQNLPTLRAQQVPLELLRNNLITEAIPKTYFLRVSYTSHSPEVSAAITNAVVASYMDSFHSFREGTEVRTRKLLQNYFSKLTEAMRHREDELAKLVVVMDPPSVVFGMEPPGVVSPQDPSRLSFTSLTEELRRSIAERLVQVDLDLATAGDPSRKTGLEGARAHLRALLALPGTAPDRARSARLTKEIEADSQRLEEVGRKLQELEFASSRDLSRVEVVDRAAVPKVPFRDLRPHWMALAAFVVLSLALAFESHRRRIEPKATPAAAAS